jgi:porin
VSTGLDIPTTLGFVPVSAYGGDVVALPWEGIVFSALALDASGTTTNNDISEAFDDGAMITTAAKATIKPFGLVSHQTVGFTWSNKTHLSTTRRSRHGSR